MVTSDSVAAESIRGGGSFAANADSRGPMDQPSHSTNTNTTDTSGATRLDPAPDAEARKASEEWSENAQMNAGLGLGKEAGRGPTWNTTSGEGDATNRAAGGGGSEGVDKPKGENLTEGGFDADAPNASFTTDIGGEDDPGRAALGRMEAANVPFAGGAGPRQGKVSDDGQYDVLEDASA